MGVGWWRINLFVIRRFVRVDSALGFWVQRIKLDVVLSEQVFVVAEAFQKVLFREPPLPPTGLYCRHALHLVLLAVVTGKLAIALDLSLLTLHTCQDACWLGPRRLREALLRRELC